MQNFLTVPPALFDSPSSLAPVVPWLATALVFAVASLVGGRILRRHRGHRLVVGTRPYCSRECKVVMSVSNGDKIEGRDRGIADAIRREFDRLDGDAIIRCPSCGEEFEDVGRNHVTYDGGQAAELCPDCGEPFIVIETVKRTYQTREASEDE